MVQIGSPVVLASRILDPLSWIQPRANEPYTFARSQTHWGLMKARIQFYLRNYYFCVVRIVYWWVKHSHTRKMCCETTLRSQGSLEGIEQREPDGLNREAPFPPWKFNPRGIYGGSVACKGKREPAAVEPFLCSKCDAWCFYTLGFTCLWHINHCGIYRTERTNLHP